MSCRHISLLAVIVTSVRVGGLLITVIMTGVRVGGLLFTVIVPGMRVGGLLFTVIVTGVRVFGGIGALGVRLPLLLSALIAPADGHQAAYDEKRSK